MAGPEAIHRGRKAAQRGAKRRKAGGKAKGRALMSRSALGCPAGPRSTEAGLAGLMESMKGAARWHGSQGRARGGAGRRGAQRSAPPAVAQLVRLNKRRWQGALRRAVSRRVASPAWSIRTYRGAAGRAGPCCFMGRAPHECWAGRERGVRNLKLQISTGSTGALRAAGARVALHPGHSASSRIFSRPS